MLQTPVAHRKKTKIVKNTFEAVVALEQARSKREKNQLTLGSLSEILKRAELTAKVVFDRTQGSPQYPHSYHGYYEDLALDSDTDRIITVDEMIQLLDSCIGQLFEQLKKNSGHYQMCKDTPLWLSHKGCHGWKIVGVELSPTRVTLLTEQEVDGQYGRVGVVGRPCSGCLVKPPWDKLYKS